MRRLARPILLILGFIVPVLIVGGWRAFGAMQRMVQYPVVAPPALDLPAPPAPDGRPVAALLTSNVGTEITDLLYPAAVLSASGAFDVVTVAPERRVSPLTGGIDILPDHSFASFAEAYPQGAELVVVPFFLDATSPLLVDWLRAQAADGSVEVLSVCEGARTAGAAGLLSGKQVTTHFWALGSIGKLHPDARWLLGTRFVEDEGIITSAGVTASLDGAVAAVRRLAGDEPAERAMAALGIEALPVEWPPPEISYGQVGVLLLNGAFLTGATPVAVAVGEGVDEVQLAALLDTYPRSLLFDLATVSQERNFVSSRFGLQLLARGTALPAEGRVLVPRSSRAPDLGAAAGTGRVGALDGLDSVAVLPWALRELAATEDQATATLVGNMIEAPEIPVVTGARAWPWPRLLVLVGIGGLGVVAVWFLTRPRRIRMPVREC